MDRERRAAPWVVVMPLKAGSGTKSRLAGFTADQRLDLARAFAEDTAAATLGTDAVTAVVAVTDDVPAAVLLHAQGCTVVPDLPRYGLNAAVQYATDLARSRWPGCWVAVLLADLPALHTDDLARALAAARRHSRAFVTDVAGRGTNMLTAAPGVPLDPRFEGPSREAHLASGAVLLGGVGLSIGCDVDNGTDLYDARMLGVGQATQAVLARIEGG